MFLEGETLLIYHPIQLSITQRLTYKLLTYLLTNNIYCSQH